jgi:hypothetical protein
MRVLAALSALFMCTACETPKARDLPAAPQSLMLKEETQEYSFVFEAGPNVLEIPDFAHTLRQEAADAKAQLIKDNAEFRAMLPNDPRDVELAYQAIWSRAADAGKLASVRMDFYGYGGGAHPITDFDGRIFDKATGKRLSLGEILNKPVALTGIPDALCKAIEVEKKARDLPFEDAGDPIYCTGPEPSVQLEGPIVFATSTEAGKAAGLRYLFGPYAIGAYVEGPYVIDVPAAAFIKDVKPEYAAGFGGAFDPNDPKDPAADMPYIGGGDR